jgi:hypothetical protein
VAALISGTLEELAGVEARKRSCTPQPTGQLTTLVKTRLRRMQYRPGLLDGFLAKTGLDLCNPHN